jgi:hypothetical protein
MSLGGEGGRVECTAIMEEPPIQSESKQPLALSYATPGKGVEPSERALKLAVLFVRDSLLPMFAVSTALTISFGPGGFILGLVRIAGFMIIGAPQLVLCVGIMFLSCWHSLQADGAKAVRQRIWPYTVIYVVISYIMPAAFFSPGYYKFSTSPLVVVMFWAWVAWPLIAGWLSRYVLLAENRVLKT